MIYGTFAQLYDELFESDMYQQWREFVESRLPKSAQTILDVAGGAGRLGVLLAQDGYQVVDFDFSEEMLSLAFKHAQEAQVPMTLVQGDMRDLNGLGQYDAITCFADSLCYLDDFNDVQATLKQMAAHLKDDGWLLFDVITPYQTDEIYPGYMYNYEDPDEQRAFLWRSYADDDVEHGVIHELTFFNRLPDDHYKRLHETHFERAYELKEWREALLKAGFNQIEVKADFGSQAIDEKTTRWFFICRKQVD